MGTEIVETERSGIKLGFNRPTGKSKLEKAKTKNNLTYINYLIEKTLQHRYDCVVKKQRETARKWKIRTCAIEHLNAMQWRFITHYVCRNIELECVRGFLSPSLCTQLIVIR